jgi:hypothetical protein
MWNNWLENFDPLNYNKVKKNTVELNEKIVNFWKDFYNDLFNNIKKDQ